MKDKKTKKRFTDTRFLKIMSIDYKDYILNKLALIMYEKEQIKRRKMKLERINRGNQNDAKDGINNDNNVYTYKYVDGLEFTTSSKKNKN